MANTYTLIASSTVGSGGAANIEFTSIPSTYTDLAVLLSLRSENASAGDTVRVQFNSSASNFTVREVSGDGAATGSSSRSDGYLGYMNAANNTADTFSSVSLYIPNYTSSNYKSYSVDKVSEQNGTTAYAELIAGLWSQTAAITTLKFIAASSADLAQHSTAYLYGIKNS
jgi:hypothetical protein